jgi:uncharacterized membrane protein
MDASPIIYGAISIIIGLILLPLVTNFIATAKANSTTASIGGLTSVLDLIAYGFCFGLVGVGIAMIVVGFKK